jgi:DNA-binding transcriptional LysR family regulator
MLDGIDALLALEKFGTVSEAAVRLRLTQSALSKRLQALQRSVGVKLMERDGRRVKITAQGFDFLERARPLVADLRGLTTPMQDGAAAFSMALADSIAASWGPRVIKRALDGLDGVSLALHAHRSVLVLESVRLGRYHIGLSTDSPSARDLIHYPVVDEPLVLLRAGPARRPGRSLPLISIEPGSATWRAIEPQIRERQPELLARAFIPVETFSASVQMVKAGFGDGLVPLGLALEMGLAAATYRAVPGVKRQISLVTRKTVNQLAGFRRLRDRLVAETERYFAHNGMDTATTRSARRPVR